MDIFSVVLISYHRLRESPKKYFEKNTVGNEWEKENEISKNIKEIIFYLN